MEIIAGNRKKIVDKVDIWPDGITPSHTSGETMKAQRLCPHEQHGLSLEQVLARGVFLLPETAQLQNLIRAGF